MSVPTSTYRLQIHPGLTLDDARGIVPYLADLGVSHVYLSPEFQSAPGSEHGYDATDLTRLDAERGGRDAFDALLADCLDAGLGLVLDIVPNHMCVTSPDNHWWRSVLQLGRASPRAEFFDIDWQSPHADGRVILPVLGDTLQTVLEQRDISIVVRQGRLHFEYHEHQWPLRPRSIAGILRTTSSRDTAFADFAEEFDSVETLAASAPGSAQLGSTLKTAEGSLGSLLSREQSVADALNERLSQLSESSELNDLLAEQHYRPMFWREGGRCVNYRRFFDIDSLAAVRAERPEVFDASSELLLKLVGLPGVDGLRIDHPDGLRDPKQYFDRLAARTRGLWTVAEKILETEEALPDDWQVAGTTGYDFLNDMLHLLIEPSSEQHFTTLYGDFTGSTEDFTEVLVAGKRRASTNLLVADLDRLTRITSNVLQDNGPSATGEQVAEVLAELATHLPVYRTYLSNDRPRPTAIEREYLAASREGAIEARPDIDPSLIEAIASILADPGENEAARECAFRFQQFSAPVTAKGVEDTAFYRYHRFPALNEVGGDPAFWSISTETFHDRTKRRHEHWPDAMLAGSTHDTKRSEDVRARLAALSENPEEWSERVAAWNQIARRCSGDDVHPSDLYLLLHTLAGAWPIDAERAGEYMTKAVREAKQRTSWRDTDEAYERALKSLIQRLLDDTEFTASMGSFADTLRTPGRIRSLTQTALRLACPGVPDIYQGCELWDLSLVDPDNRRPVDYTLRRELCERLDATRPDQRWTTLEDPDDPGLTKLWLTQTLLRLRREHPDVFSGTGDYAPVPIAGTGAGCLIAFARSPRGGEPFVVAVLPLRSTTAADAEIELPAPASGRWRNLCDDRTIQPGPCQANDLFATAPLALLVDEEKTT